MCELENRLFSEENIFLAIYSVESYIQNKELLSLEDKIELIHLKDKFNEEIIDMWVSKVKKRLSEIYYSEDKYLDTKVFFKPKKFTEGAVCFRPLHVSSLLDQIVAVSMLNVLVYDFDGEGRMSMSNLSRLIPHNFYGNRIAYEPENLYKPWQSQYKEYTSRANELYVRYHDTLEYKWEVSLDLENFFPSINPISLINYIIKYIPVNLNGKERNVLITILKKLVFVKLEKMNNEDTLIYTNSLNSKKCEFALGLPQGLPQSSFLANLFMIILEKLYTKYIPGEMLFYVDDSVVFTNSQNSITDFDSVISAINEELNKLVNEFYKIDNFSSSVKNFVEEYKELFKLKIHKIGDKSTISNIQNVKEEEIYIHCIGRETSKMAFDFNTNYSDEETIVLLNKTEAILQVLENELTANLDKNIVSSSYNETIYESYKKKLVRYKKFFKYRSKDLNFRAKLNVNELKEELLEDLDSLDSSENIENFFLIYNEDILAANISFVLKSLYEAGEDYAEILTKLKKLNYNLFHRNNRTTSYIYKVYCDYFETTENNKRVVDIIYENKSEIDSYTSLRKKIKHKMQYINKKNDSVRIEEARRLLNGINLENSAWLIESYIDKRYEKFVKLVVSNSITLQRMILNSIFSCVFHFEINDSVILYKANNRKITYFELRVLELLRNRYFTNDCFNKLISDFIKEEYLCSIDYSIMEVISIFRTFIRNPDYIDNLILIHKYTCDIWKNGSKHLYFYTLHNQEHAIDLIQNSIKVLRAIDYIDISKNDYYVLFIACYLHDMSMVTLPNLDNLQHSNYQTDKIYSDFIKDAISTDIMISSKGEVLKLLKNYYMRIDSFYENLVRDNHAKDSANEIRNRVDLAFIEASLREIVAEVSEAHCFDTRDIYKTKSTASSKLWSKKFVKIILRLSDLLDMSNYRVSKAILEHNLDNMGDTSRFHWLSHLVTHGYEIETRYSVDPSIRSHYLKSRSIIENIIFTVNVNLPQLSRESPSNCSFMKLDKVSGLSLELKCGENCNGKECNFLCKWFVKKNNYLFTELSALKEYLTTLPNNYYQTQVSVIIKSNDVNELNPKQFAFLKKYVDKD